MFKKSALVSAIFIISTFIQLISQIVVTRLFGATQELDIFLAAVTIPSIVVTVIYSTLSNVLIPFFSEAKHKNEKTAEHFLSSLLYTMTIFSLGLTLVCSLLSFPLGHLLYPGRTQEFASAVSLQMAILFLATPFAVIATILGSYFYFQKKFFHFPIAQLIGSIVNVVCIVTLYHYIGIWSLVAAFIINILFQIFFVIPKHVTVSKFKFININLILLALIPLIIGEFMRRSDTLLIRSFASYLPTGYIVYLNLVSKIFSLATSVTTVGIQVLLLPNLVDYFANKEYKKASEMIAKSKWMAILISVVVTISVIVIGPFAVSILFKGGKFTETDIQITNELLMLFIVPAIGWGVSGVYLQPLFALKKYKDVGILQTVALLIAWITASLVNTYYGALFAIIFGLIVLLFIGIIGSEFVWQQEKRKLLHQK